MPKKKSKGSKLARMSDEERARYLQHRAEIELEAKRRKQQLIATYTKNKLKREEGFSRLNTAKINEQWRFILRQIKCKELHQDVEYLWKNFDRLIQVKDEIIRRLYKELEIANRDHRKLKEAHMEIINEMIEKNTQKLLSIDNFYTKRLDEIKVSDVDELRQLKAKIVENSKEILNIISNQSEIWEDRLIAAKIQNAANMYSITFIKDDITTQLVHRTSKELETYWEQLNLIVDSYEISTSDKRKQYEYLKEQDDAHQVEAAQFPRLHSQLQNTIESLRNDIEDLSEKREDRISRLKFAMKRLKNKSDSIKKEFLLSQAVNSARLKKLSVVSNNISKDLQRISDKSSTILQFVKTCSNLEPLLINLKRYNFRSSEVQKSSPSPLTKTFDKLNNFWDQFNYIKADNILLKKGSEELLQENRRLRHSLHTYFIGISGYSILHPVKSVAL